MDFKKELFEQYKLSGEDLENSIKYFEPEVFKAKSYFLKQGKVSDKIGVLKSGLLRSFVYNDNADDITTHFFQPGNVVISMDSFNNQTPSRENIVAIEDAELLVITYQRMKELYHVVPLWRQIAKDVDEIKYNNLMNRSIRFQTLSASERYQLFIQNNPEIIKRVALRHIASYIGVDIATLSRIRKKQ